MSVELQGDRAKYEEAVEKYLELALKYTDLADKYCKLKEATFAERYSRGPQEKALSEMRKPMKLHAVIGNNPREFEQWCKMTKPDFERGVFKMSGPSWEIEDDRFRFFFAKNSEALRGHMFSSVTILPMTTPEADVLQELSLGLRRGSRSV